MGFLDSDVKTKATIDGAAAYQMMAAGDLPGAWMILQRADATDDACTIYNKAFCMRSAGRGDEAMELAGKADTVVEIGTGAGTLTAKLAERAARVFSFEVDERLKPVLDLTLRGIDNVEVVFRDIMKMRDGEVQDVIGDGEFSVVANLPYYITTPLIMRFIESALPVRSLTVMVQKEVADRLRAACGTADYSAVTVAVEMFGDAEVTRMVDRQMFRPAPNVDSAVVHISRVPGRVAQEDAVFVKRVVRAAFAMRRKTLANNLSAAFGMSKAKAAELITECGFSADVRGERLSLDDFVTLSKAISSAQS